MQDPTLVQAVADTLAENRDELSDALNTWGDREDPGYDADLIHLQALDQAHDLLVDYANLLENQ